MNGLFSAKLVMLNGGTIVLMTEFHGARLHPRRSTASRVDMVTSVPTMLALVMRETDDARQRRPHVASPSPLPARRLRRRSSSSRCTGFFPAPRRPTAGARRSRARSRFGAHPDGIARPPGALGYPRKGIEVKFVGGDEPANQGVLHIRTPALMTGYLNREADTKKRLIDGWYDTGDVMRRDANGFVFFVGRADDMFQCGGENVYPGEVEKLLGPPSRRGAGLRRAGGRRDQVPAAGRLRGAEARRHADAKTRCAASRSTTGRPMPIRGRCGSSTSCRSPAPTRSTARCWSIARPRPTARENGRRGLIRSRR